MECGSVSKGTEDSELEGAAKGEHSSSIFLHFFLGTFSRGTGSHPQDVITPDDENKLLRDLGPLLL